MSYGGGGDCNPSAKHGAAPKKNPMTLPTCPSDGEPINGQLGGNYARTAGANLFNVKTLQTALRIATGHESVGFRRRVGTAIDET